MRYKADVFFRPFLTEMSGVNNVNVVTLAFTILHYDPQSVDNEDDETAAFRQQSLIFYS